MTDQPSRPIEPCPACGRPVSAAARSCPHCGHPLQDAQATVEQTAKIYKAWILGGSVSVLVGFLLWCHGCAEPGSPAAPWGGLLLILGAITYTCARVAAWWHHG